MSKSVEAKKQAVLRAIETLYSDTSVSRTVTLDALGEVQEELAIKVESLEGEIAEEEDTEG